MTSSKVLFLFTMRAGSHYTGRILSGIPYYNIAIPEEDNQSRFVITETPNTCPLYTPGNLTNMSTKFLNPDSQYEKEVFLSYVSDGPTTPGSGVDFGMAWTIDEIRYANSVVDLKVVHILRDGRNQLASLKELEHSTPKVQWPDSRWMDTCRQFKFRARNALNATKSFENYKIVRFEDVMMNHFEVWKDIAEFTKIPLDTSKLKKIIEEVTPNSSFQRHEDGRQEWLKKFKDSDVLERWKTLTKRERSFMQSVAGQELLELGYIKDDSWVNEDEEFTKFYI